MKSISFISNSELETVKLARSLAPLFTKGDVILLTGDLGAGKTTFVGGVLKELGYNEHVVSPTFNILKCYFDVNPHVYHIDAYRLEDANTDIGLEEFIEGDGITFIEWPCFIKELIPIKHLNINLVRLDDNKREITISTDDEFYKDIFTLLEKK